MSAEIEQFERLFIDDIPLIDTRAPIEFAKGSFPHAVNLPLMTDDERAQVGTCYKKQGQDAAIALGHELVSGNTKSARVEQWRAFAEANPHGALFCFRGGMRSGISQQWLADAGVAFPRIKGGYKAMRRWLMETLDALCQERRFIVVGGRTGSAKTRLLVGDEQSPALVGSIDLEGLAHHRGSAFGRRVTEQPSQIGFEIALAIAVLKTAHATDTHLLVEDESRLIGRCALPLAMQEVIKTSDVVLLEASLTQRIEHSFDNYILQNLRDFERLLNDSNKAFECFEQGLLDALSRIQKRLGGERYKQLLAIMDAALVEHRRGNPERHREWIAPLLSDYYDPMYDYQLKHKGQRVIFKGDAHAISAFLQTQAASPA